MSPALNRSYMLERFERGNAMEIRNGIMFDFYPRLPHMEITDLFAKSAETSFIQLRNKHVSLVPRLSWNPNIYRGESLVSFLHKHDVIKIGLNRKAMLCALFNQL